jgi:predicted dehydrogenase
MREISRRSFLREAGVTAAAVGVGILGRGTVSGGIGPNDTVRAAVIGVKGRGRSHIDGFRGLPKVEVVALCDIDEGELEKAARDLEKASSKTAAKKADLYTDVRKLLEDKSIDVVGIATPNHWHSLAAIWACQAGKDVYVEKPCSHNVSEGRRLVETARKHDRIVQHGTQCRSNPGLQEAVRQLRSGVIGDVYMARGLCYKWRNTIGKTKDEAAPPGVHYDIWLGPAPERPFSRNRFHYSWHWHWDYGNGDIGNQGVHQMDIARWGLGVGLPSKIQAAGAHYLFDDDQETPNTMVATFEYPAAKESEKKMIVFEVRHWITNPEGEGKDPCDVGVLFYGSDGYMSIPSYDKFYTFLGKKREPGPKGSGGGDHFANFIGAVRSRKKEELNSEIEEGHLSAAMCHLANVAYRAGRTVRFDPKAETCIEDSEASKLLTRQYRPPFVVPATV